MSAKPWKLTQPRSPTPIEASLRGRPGRGGEDAGAARQRLRRDAELVDRRHQIRLDAAQEAVHVGRAARREIDDR